MAAAQRRAVRRASHLHERETSGCRSVHALYGCARLGYLAQIDWFLTLPAVVRRLSAAAVNPDVHPRP